MLESIVFIFNPLVKILGIVSLFVFLSQMIVRESVMHKKLFDSIDDELKDEAAGIAKKEKIFLRDVVSDFVLSLKCREIKQINDEGELNSLFRQYLKDHEEYREKIGVLFDTSLHLKLFELKTDIDELTQVSFIRIFKRKSKRNKVISHIENLLNRPVDLAKVKLSQILSFVKKGQSVKAREEINSLYQLAISTFPEKSKEDSE